ncbi:katanin p60 ATPase-containing subunit A-like 2 [Musca vetustissima]|uniref:katanin p60 ATPase-containing subunit A-like 2 n=1 Tax=Musca vetustissima TaxID=27455 RepID=UPI002AB6719B|nr:katanin p60 ATPase-containing subunit A-like 2 [Musca vetustissima]
MSKDDEVRNVQNRRRNILFLVQRYLQDTGLYGTAAALATEASRLLSEDFELCDNIDLDGIYLEYASYYQLKFGKYPKIVKRARPGVKVEVSSKARKKNGRGNVATDNKEGRQEQQETLTGKGVVNPPPSFDVNDLQIVVKKMETAAQMSKGDMSPADSDTLERNGGAGGGDSALNRLQEIQHHPQNSNPGGDLLLSCQEWQNLAELVKSTILTETTKLKWSDICGNSQAMETIKEAVVTPLKYPQLFSNGLKPWRSVLLHGPPGSGKTLLAKVLYSETQGQVTFFNITSSVVISKWRGESEKLLKILFYLAQRHAPSIIFFDEIEGLTSKRDRSTDHESSKRFKNELLQLMDGMENSTQQGSGVFILASTNLPWEIDEAFLRRFEKKLLVQLPNEMERRNLIAKLIPPNVRLVADQMTTLVKLSHNFTGDEIRLACKEIAMQTVRRLTKATLKGDEPSLEDVPVENAFKLIKPLSLLLMDKHSKWQKEHGS